MEKHEHVHHKWEKIFVNNFIGGIAWGLGATVGVSIVLAFAGLIFSQINFIPFVGDFITSVIDYIQSNNPQLR